MLELREQKLYEHALPELEDELNRCARRADFQPDAEHTAHGLFRHRPRSPLRVVRAAVVRLVPVPGARSDRRAGRLAFDRPHSPAQHHPARQRRGRVLPRVAAQSHQARVARPESALGRQIRSRGALRSEREDRAVIARFDQAFCPHRRQNVGRRRADHQAPACRAGRVRRPVHSRDHVDRQSHLPLRPPRLAGRHAGHRRSDLDDPLHQQGVPDGALGAKSGADAADRDHCRGHRSHQGYRRARFADGGENPRRLFFARRAQDRIGQRVQAHQRRAVRGDRSRAGAKISADRVRLARRRARRRAAVRVPVPHGARALAGREIPARRLVARGRLPRLRDRSGARPR